MPDQKQKRIHAECTLIAAKQGKLDFKEARRLKGPIYDVLLQELNEEGCTKSAKHFETLVRKELSMLENRIIRVAVHDERRFLLMLVDNFKLAELSLRLGKCGGRMAALQLFYQNLLMTERYRNHFDWLLGDLYTIVMKVLHSMGELDVGFNEIRMRLYYKCGCYDSQQVEGLLRGINYLQQALDLATGQLWAPDTPEDIENYKSMHQAIAHALGEVLLKQAKVVSVKNLQHAFALSHRAIVTLATVGIEENKELLHRAYLTEIQYLIELKKYDLAMIKIDKTEERMLNDKKYPHADLKCELYLFKGRCYYYTNELNLAIKTFNKAYSLCRIYHVRDLQAHILVYLGRTHSKFPNHEINAQRAFTTAKHIFVEQEDAPNSKKSSYLLAQLIADRVYPEFCNLMKSKDYCDFYMLRRWKNQCKPFWYVKESVSDTGSEIKDSSSETSSSVNTADFDGENVEEEEGQYLSTEIETHEMEEEEMGNIEMDEKARKILKCREAQNADDFEFLQDCLSAAHSEIRIMSMDDMKKKDNLYCLLHEYESNENGEVAKKFGMYE